MSTKQLFTPTSSWTPHPTPPPQDPSHLPSYVRDLIDLDFFENSFKTLRIKSNLTPEEIAAVKELINNKNITIKPADNSSMVVIMDLEQYLWEGNRQTIRRPKLLF